MPDEVRVRRVVTGEPTDRSSEFTHVEEVAPLINGLARIYSVWGFDAPPILPFHSHDPYADVSMFPPVAGVRVQVIVFPPPPPSEDAHSRGQPLGVETTAGNRELRKRLDVQGFERLGDPDAPPGMHRTNTIDIGVVISGRLGVTCTDGSEEVLEVGDVYVQNGAMHSWRGLDHERDNAAAFVILGAERRQQEEPDHQLQTEGPTP